jgi:hypothetical protein
MHEQQNLCQTCDIKNDVPSLDHTRGGRSHPLQQQSFDVPFAVI